MADGGPEARRRILAVGLKSYLGYADTLAWLAAMAGPAEQYGEACDVVVFPVAPALPEAVRLGRQFGFSVGAQDVSELPPGPYTGELPAALYRELGVDYAEIGHAERRFLRGDTVERVTRKAATSVELGLVPLLCVGEGRLGEATRLPTDVAAAAAAEQLEPTLTGLPADAPFVVAYEPVWAIGAEVAAPPDHVATVVDRLREMLTPFPLARIVYGGSAGPGLFDELSGSVDGLFLGRRAHDPARFAEALSEVARTAVSP